MTELELHQQTNLPAKIEFARALAASNLLPAAFRGHPENLLWALEYAQAIGIEPMAAIQGIDVIQGKPAPSASLIASLVRRAGHKLRVERIPDGARATIIRKDDPDFPHVTEFTLADAKLAGLLGKDNWKLRPLVMCEWRAISACARKACSEVLFGLHYTADEIEEAQQTDGAYQVTTAPKRVTAADILHRTPAPTPDNPVVDVEDVPDGYDDAQWVGQETLA